MPRYAFLLWLQTLGALGALALLGGWALRPFRRPDRPYLWLAAPLAGLNVLAGCLFLLFHGAGLGFPAALAASALLALPTLYLAARRPRLPGGRGHALAAVAAVAAVGLWCTHACNRTSARHREPTIALAEGSDAWGYCAAAAWHLDRPHQRPAF